MSDSPSTAVAVFSDNLPVTPQWEYPNRLELELSTPAETRHEVQQQWDAYKAEQLKYRFRGDTLLDGLEKIYSTTEAANFFNRSVQWVYWGLRKDKVTGRQVFCYRNGDPILPERYGKMGKRRFTLPIIREIALCCYRRGNLPEEELEMIMARILIAEFGKQAFAALPE